MRRERLNRIVGYALSRTEAYVVVVLVFVAVVVAVLGDWPGWTIMASVAVGVVLMALLIADSLADPGVERDASIADVDAGRIGDAELRARVRRALEYVRAAHRLVGRDATGVLGSVGHELPQMEEAVRSIFQMSLRLQDFRADQLIRRDLADLQMQRARKGVLGPDQEAQLAALRRLDRLVRAAEQEIDSAVAHLGWSYAEMHAIKVTPELRGRASDALDQLKASTARLSELARGYDEAFGGAGAGRRPDGQGVVP